MKNLLSLLVICGLATLGAYLGGEYLPLAQWLEPLFSKLHQTGFPWMGQNLLWVLAMALPAGFVGGVLLSFYTRLAGPIGFFSLLLAAAVSLSVMQADLVQRLLQGGLSHPPFLILLGVDLLVRALLLKRFSGGEKPAADRGQAERLARAQQRAEGLRQDKEIRPQASAAAAGWGDASFSRELESAGTAVEKPRPRKRQHRPLHKPRTRIQHPKSRGIVKVRQTGPVGIERCWRA